MALISFIPEKFQKGFTALYNLDDDNFEAIIDTLSAASLTASPANLIEKIAQSSSVSVETIENIIRSIGSLIGFLEREEKVDNIVNSVCDVIDESNLIDLTETSNREMLSLRLAALLRNEQLYYSLKGADLLTEVGNILISSRIVTDIRPVFGIDTNSEPKASLIIHNLHIHYKPNEEGPHEDIFFALDSNDIKALKDLLTRAEKKENSLRIILDKSGVVKLN